MRTNGVPLGVDEITLTSACLSICPSLARKRSARTFHNPNHMVTGSSDDESV